MGDLNDPFMRNKDAAVQARTKAQNRANVLQLKLIGQSHPTGLTTNLLKLFEPRPPLEYKPPPEKRKCPPYTGMAQYTSFFAEPGQPEYAPPVQKGETRAQKKARIQKARLEKGVIKAAEELQKYDPSKDPNISGDPYKTLFVARLNYETTEHRIKREFEAYGPIKRVRLITDKETNKPRGYGFIEYMHTRDMKTAYKQADGRKLDNRRVLVDVERGRTVPNWRPRRLGGGLGSTRVGGEEVNQKHSGREQQQQIASGGPPRSEEPRVRDDRPRDQEREKSRERIRDREREREKSHDRPHDRIRDRDPPREDSRLPHPRDRDRYRDKDRERDRGRDQDRVRSRDERDRGRDYDRDRPRERERGRERERDYDRPSHEKDRGYPRGRDVEYDHLEPARDREPASRERDVGHGGYDDGGEEWYNEPLIKHRRERDYDHYEKPRSQERYDRLQTHDLDEPERGAERLKQHDPGYYDREPYDKLHHDVGLQDPEPREEGEAVEEHDYAYQRSERSLSREYKG